MKKYTYIIVAIVSLVSTGCFDEYDGTVEIATPWAHFELGSISAGEDIGTAVTGTLFLSGPPPVEDVVVPFLITTEDELVEGTDYIQPNTSFTVPAGQNRITVNLLDGIVNDDTPTGNRSLTITLQDSDVVLGGLPGPNRESGSITISIGEDDFTQLAFTSFEEPVGLDVDYQDTGDPAISRELQNNPGQAPVQFTSTGGELGFRTFYTSTGGEGSTDGDDLGVTTKTSLVGTYADGVQGYYADDTDGVIDVVFDEVDISGATVLQFRFQYLLNSTGWETEDIITATLEAGDGSTLTVLSLDGDIIDDTGLDPDPHIWHQVVIDASELIAGGTVQLTLRVQTNSGNEEVYFDDIVFEGIL